MKKLILGLVVLSFGICFAESVDFDDEFEDVTEYDISDGIEEDDDVRYPVRGKRTTKYEVFDGIEDDDDGDFEDDIDVSYLVYTPQTSGWTIGGYFSVLDIKPTFSFIQDSFEVELSCNIVAFDFYYSYILGVGPGIAIGYISNPFEGGVQNCVGVSYVWYPMDNTHIASIYYRFGVRSVFGNGFITEFNLPIVALLAGNRFTSIADVNMIPYGLLYSLATISVGYKFYF